MKYLYKLLPILFIAVLIASCDESGGEDLDPEVNNLERLQGTWKIKSVTKDGSDVSSDFSGFALTFSQSTYTITNGGLAFVDTSGSLVSFDGNAHSAGDFNTQASFVNTVTLQVIFTYSHEDKTLTLEITVDNDTFGLGGRGEGLAGSYIFVLNK